MRLGRTRTLMALDRGSPATLGLKVTGLVGLLGKAAQRGMLDLSTAVRRLRGTSFHIAPKILKELLER